MLRISNTILSVEQWLGQEFLYRGNDRWQRIHNWCSKLQVIVCSQHASAKCLPVPQAFLAGERRPLPFSRMPSISDTVCPRLRQIRASQDNVIENWVISSWHQSHCTSLFKNLQNKHLMLDPDPCSILRGCASCTLSECTAILQTKHSTA